MCVILQLVSSPLTVTVDQLQSILGGAAHYVSIVTISLNCQNLCLFGTNQSLTLFFSLSFRVSFVVKQLHILDPRLFSCSAKRENRKGNLKLSLFK